MKQVLQSMRNGKTSVAEVPVPAVRRGCALVRTGASLVSAGTERMLVEFGEKNLVEKAQARPDLVRQVLDKARREGLIPTLEATFNRLDQPMSLGYSSAGVIIAVGEGLQGYQVGDRVACAGGGYAVHAEYGNIPQNLLARLPDNVDFESAAFSTLGAIAMHGFRLAAPQFGERVAIIGLGLLGLLAGGIARAAGCSVFGVDLSPLRVDLAHKMGMDAVTRAEAEEAGRAVTGGQGFDIVLICADAKSDDPIELAGALARDRGRVVAVGAVGLNIPRKTYYEKELQFQVSRSYGPGRYDPNYEENGLDYPIGFVRWTEGRNLGAFVDLLAKGLLDVKPLISHCFPIEQAPDAYELITGKKGDPFLGVLLTYDISTPNAVTRRVEVNPSPAPLNGALGLGVLGAGNYATAVFLPVVQKVGGIQTVGIASAAGLNASNAAHRYHFNYASSSEQEVLDDPKVNVVAILTRHAQHAHQVSAALNQGKAVFCEKPLAISFDQIDELEKLLTTGNVPLLMVGFNRRFAPFAQKLKTFFTNRAEPMMVSYRINAGYLPLSHWTQDPAVGGGRIIGEGCHFIDFLTFMTGTAPVSVSALALPDGKRYRQDNIHLTFTYPDGSVGAVTYLANGDKSFPKERVEVFCGGKVGVLDDFRSLELVQNGHRQVLRSVLRQEKGHRQGWETFLKAVKAGGPAPIPYTELFAVSRAAIAAQMAVQTGETQRLV
jgi:predicted dehydrogenase/threonine dehydrogenase-like Zn-dependent dehydrogenase